ncbi:hypothetical protein EUTSA_v10009398mg [Eutrema salsugineum]|uniref:Bet v I/Major latex protein domain-containing protein n=1 Tax=Eutrema salsugineum TaxID=72664 RepID=V4MRH2_EUTSA|nr:hypothetical protein EUTSA_v10009398mg [Eutrema salsugineum]
MAGVQTLKQKIQVNMKADRVVNTIKKKEGSFNDKTMERTKSVSFLALEGDVLKQYKSYKVTLNVVPKDDRVCIAKWTWEYEKLNDDVPPLTKYSLQITRATSRLGYYHENMSSMSRSFLVI